MYSQGAVKFRADISAAVEQASGWESGLIAGRVAPVVNVDAKDGQYPRFLLTSGNLLKRESNIQRAPGGRYARGSLAYEWDNYATKEYGFELPLDKVNELEASRFFNAATVVANQAKRKPLLEWEIRAAAMTFNTSNYGSGISATAAYTIANLATIDIGLDVDAAKEQIAGKGESTSELSVVLSKAVYNRVRASTKLQNRLRGIGISSDTILNVDAQAVAEALGVKEVLVGENYYDSAAQGVDFSSSAIWGNTYVWVGRLSAGGSPESMLAGGSQYTLNWSQYGPAMSVFEYEEPQSNSTIFRASHHVTEKVVNGNAGALITTSFA